MKIKFRNLLMYVAVLALLLECDYFINVPVSILAEYNQKYIIIAILSIFSMVMCLFDNRIKLSIRKEIKMLNKPVMATMLAVLVASFYSLIVSDLSLNAVLINILPCFSLFLVYPLVYIFKDERTRKRFLILFFLIVAVTLLYRTKATYDYSINHILPNATILIPNGGVQVRYGVIKIYPTSVGALAVILLFAYAISDIPIKKWKQFIMLGISFLGYLYFAFLYQARLWTIMILFIWVSLLFYKRDRLSKKVMIYIVVITIAIYLLTNGIANNFFKSFTKESQYWHSTEARLNGIGILLYNIVIHPFGNGFLSEFSNNGVTYYSDDYLGLQSFYRFGLFAIPIYVTYIHFFLHNLKICKKNKYQVVQLALVMFVIFGCLLIGVFVTRRLFALPIVFALSISLCAENDNSFLQMSHG